MQAVDGLFDPVQADSMAQAVVVQIEDLILSGVLKSGQKLPSERDLAERLQVSRPTVRDAIKTLEGRELLIVKHGDGTFVANLTGTALSPAMIDLFQRRPEAFLHYLEYRMEVEGYAAFLAAQRATDADLAAIRHTIEAIEAAHEKDDPAEEAALDVALHTIIVDATHNAMLIHMMASIYDLMRRGVFYNRDFLYTRPGGRAALLAQHQTIARAILARDAAAACAAAEDHLRYVRSAFTAGQEEEGRMRIARKRLALLDVDASPPPARARGRAA